MKISDKAKIIVFLLASFFTAIQSNAQCTVNVIQDDECNNNGILEIIPDPTFSSPHNLEVDFPNGSLFTTVFAEDTFLLAGLDGASGGTYDGSEYKHTDKQAGNSIGRDNVVRNGLSGSRKLVEYRAST